MVTSLENQAMDLLRYRTGDRVTVRADPCSCGRPGRRLRVLHRTDDLTKIRGVLCSKQDLVDSVRSVAGVEQFKIVIFRDAGDVDRVAVTITTRERAPGSPGDIKGEVRQQIRSRLRIGLDQVDLVDAIEVPRTVSGKPRPILDERGARPCS